MANLPREINYTFAIGYHLMADFLYFNN